MDQFVRQFEKVDHIQGQVPLIEAMIEGLGLAERSGKPVKDEPPAIAEPFPTTRSASSSGKSFPWIVQRSASAPISLPRAFSSRIAPVEAAGIPNVAARRAACVPFPEAGGPSRTMRFFMSYCRVAKKMVTPGNHGIPRLA